MKWQDWYMYALGIIALVSFIAFMILHPSEAYLQAIGK